MQFILSFLFFLPLFLFWISSYQKHFSIQKTLLQTTILLFIYTLTLLCLIGFLEWRNTDLYFYNFNINEGLILFAMWYYPIPVIFLFITLFLFLIRYLKKQKLK